MSTEPQPQFIPTMYGEPYAYLEIMNKDADPWPNVKEYDVCLYASHSNMSFHMGASSNAAARLSLTPTDVMFYNDFWMTNSMVMRGIQLQESPVGDNTPYQVTQQVSDMKGYDPWGAYIKITLSNTQQGFQVLDSQKVPQITLSTTTGRIHANSNDSPADPSYSFSNNSNLGMYHYQNDVIGFASLGLDSARIHSYGRLVLSNQTLFRPSSNYLSLFPTMRTDCNVEFRFHTESNNTRPTFTLYSSNRDVLQIGKSTSNAFMYTCNNNLDIGTNFQSHLFIDPAGQIGLKTQLPTTHLVVNNGGLPLSNAQLQLQNTADPVTQNALFATIKAGSTGAPSDNYFAQGYNSNIPTLRVHSSNADPLRMAFTNSLHTSNIEIRFQAESNFTRPTLTFYDNASNVLHIGKSTSNAFMYTCNNNLDIGTNFQSHLFIDPAGQIGLKTQLPTAHFVVNNGTLPLSNYDLQVQHTADTLSNTALYAAIKSGSTGAANCNYVAFGYRSNIPMLLVNRSNDPLTVYINNTEVARFQASNGFLGLFSNAPAYQFDMVGSARISSNLFLTQTNRASLAINTLTPTTANMHVEATTRSYNAAAPLSNAALYVNNAGSASSNHSLIALQANGGNPFLSFNSFSNYRRTVGWSLGVDTPDNQKFKLSPNVGDYSQAAITFDASGSIGINTTTPTGRLCIATSTAASAKTQLGPDGRMTRLYVQTLTDDRNAAYMGVVKTDSNWVGLGYAVDNTPANNNCGELRMSSTTEPFSFNFGGTVKFIMEPTGRMGINLANITNGRSSSPSTELEVNGTIKASTDVITTSDRRLKTNITPINDSLFKVKRLSGCTFNRMQQQQQPTTAPIDKRYAGLIAQDVQPVLPEAVETDNDGYMSVSYGSLTALLVEAIKELSSRVEAIEERLASTT